MAEIAEQTEENDIQIVHAIPGRVRLRASSKLISKLEILAGQLGKLEGVSEVRTNPTSSSLIVNFDASTISLPQMLGILQQSGVSEASKKNEPLQVSQPLGENLKSAQTLIPVIAGMVVTGGLGIEGVMALPVYAIAETATRELMKLVSDEGKISLETTAAEEKEEAAIVEQDDNVVAADKEVFYSIVHAIPGRIRFRVPRIAQDPEYVRILTALLKSEAIVTDVRVNSGAASIAISYAAEGMEDEEVRSHLINIIKTASNSPVPTNSKAASNEEETEEEPNPWVNVGLPAFTTALALLGGPLGLPIPPAIIGGTIAITALPVAKRAIDSILTEQRLNIDVLDLMAITITTLQGQFVSPSLMIFLVETGEAIREQTARSSKRQTLDLLDSLKQLVWVERNKEKQQISIHEVQRGDTVIVYPGEQIPVDGRILRGKALIDEQKLTGESMPVMRTKGQTVLASTLVREGQVYILTEQIGADTRAGQIIKVMQDAPVHDTRIENYAANIADNAVVPTILLSGIVFAITRNFARAASVLTLDFATGIRVSVPTTVLAALTYAARRGILIRSGRALEKLATVNAVVFDKTGTLTQGAAVVVSVETASNLISPLQVLELAASAEQRLTHPVAEAIVRHAQEQGAKILPRGKWDYQIGLGVRAEIDGKTVLVGSDRLLDKEGISLDKLHEKHSSQTHSAIYVACNGELLGAIAYRDPLRPESREVIKALRTTNGMEIHLLTGDNKRTASAVAAELGIETTHTHAEAFPEQKVAVVKGLHEEGRTVAFVGDGINDSPALAYADVSVSFGNGSDVARETADVVLMENNLSGLPEAIAISRQAMQLIHENTGIVAVPNLVALVLAATIGIEPLVATAVNNGSAIVAGLNGLRPLFASSNDLDLLAASEEEPETAQEQQIDSSISNENSQIFLPLEELTNGIIPQPLEVRNDSLVIAETVNTALIEQTAIAPRLEQTVPLVANDINPQELEVNADSLVIAEPANTALIEETAIAELLTGTALARRLKVSAGTISRRKSKPDFPQWTRSKDPDGFTWKYSKISKLFSAA